MNKQYRDAYYPQGETMEERLFRVGQQCTRIPITTWLTVFGVGVGVALFGMGIAWLIEVMSGLGWVISFLGDLTVAVGLFGIGMYLSGLHCLERAELLYNTRLAGKEEKEEENSEFFQPKAQPRDQASVWKCTCGKENPDYTSVCACGVKRWEVVKKPGTVKASVATQAGEPQGKTKPAASTMWKCTCGKENPGYTSVCTCGVKKWEITK